MSEEFSVYWWDREGGQHEEMRFVAVESALRAVTRLTQGPAAMLGMVQRVLITDGGDCTCFDWRDGKLIYPLRESAP
jgi:hypothetical protein